MSEEATKNMNAEAGDASGNDDAGAGFDLPVADGGVIERVGADVRGEDTGAAFDAPATAHDTGGSKES